MREQNKGFSESKLENKKNKINAIRINIKAKNNSEDNTMKTTKNPVYAAVHVTVMRMRQLNLVSGALLWCVHLDEISSTTTERRRKGDRMDG
jgi:hypothetical protein